MYLEEEDEDISSNYDDVTHNELQSKGRKMERGCGREGVDRSERFGGRKSGI